METKYCKDCKHCTDAPVYKCIHPTYGVNPVTGAKRWMSCNDARSSSYYNNSPCGAKGNLFEVKEVVVKNKTLFCKIINLFKERK